MKKQEYIAPRVSVFSIMSESVLALSTNLGTDAPDYGGDYDGSEGITVGTKGSIFDENPWD